MSILDREKVDCPNNENELRGIEMNESLNELIQIFWTYDCKTQIEFRHYLMDLFGCMSAMSAIGDHIERSDRYE